MRLAMFLLFQPEAKSLFTPAAGINAQLDRGRKGTLFDEFVNHGPTESNDTLDLF